MCSPHLALLLLLRQDRSNSSSFLEETQETQQPPRASSEIGASAFPMNRAHISFYPMLGVREKLQGELMFQQPKFFHDPRARGKKRGVQQCFQVLI